MVDKLLEARVRALGIRARIAKAFNPDEARDKTGRWVSFKAWGSQPGTPDVVGQIVGQDNRGMTYTVEDKNGRHHTVPTEGVKHLVHPDDPDEFDADPHGGGF